MSLAAKLTFASSCAFTIGTISYVHVVHKLERDDVKQGVKQYLEKQSRKQSLLTPEEQSKLTEAIRLSDENKTS